MVDKFKVIQNNKPLLLTAESLFVSRIFSYSRFIFLGGSLFSRRRLQPFDKS